MSDLPYAILRTNSEPQSSEFLHDSYLMHRKTTRCTRCNSENTTSEIFEVQIHPTRNIRRLVPAKELKPGFEVGLSTLQVREQPACFLCFDTLPQESIQHYADEDEWRRMLLRKQAEKREAKAATASAVKVGPSLEDL
jgi:hypothetical protein